MSTFRARIRPTLGSTARELVGIYESTPGSTGPGCCPEALAAVLVHIAAMDVCITDLRRMAADLEGDG